MLDHISSNKFYFWLILTLWTSIGQLCHVTPYKPFTFSISDGSLHIVYYEDLKENTMEELTKMLRFLSIAFKSVAKQCVRNNIEGYYHRKPTKDTLYPLLSKSTQHYMDKIYNQIRDVVQRKHINKMMG